jgi:hypothetical protein
VTVTLSSTALHQHLLLCRIMRLSCRLLLLMLRLCCSAMWPCLLPLLPSNSRPDSQAQPLLQARHADVYTTC